MKSREERKRVRLVKSCVSKLLGAKPTTTRTLVGDALEVGNDHVNGNWAKDPYLSVLYGS